MEELIQGKVVDEFWLDTSLYVSLYYYPIGLKKTPENTHL